MPQHPESPQIDIELQELRTEIRQLKERLKTPAEKTAEAETAKVAAQKERLKLLPYWEQAAAAGTLTIEEICNEKRYNQFMINHREDIWISPPCKFKTDYQTYKILRDAYLQPVFLAGNTHIYTLRNFNIADLCKLIAQMVVPIDEQKTPKQTKIEVLGAISLFTDEYRKFIDAVNPLKPVTIDDVWAILPAQFHPKIALIDPELPENGQKTEPQI